MRRIALVIALVLGLVVAGCGSDERSGLFSDDGSTGSADYHYVIPAGSGEAIDRGEPLDILPPELTVRVGEVIELVNEDDRGHLVGPFFVGKGETLRQRFADTGTFVGRCSVHPSGEILLNVTE
jgi:hypothetical protein